MKAKIVNPNDKFESRYVNYISETLTEKGINHECLPTNYEPDYQGCLLILIVPPMQPLFDEKLEEIIDEFNMGDPSYTFTQIKDGMYLIDICE